MAPGRHRKTPGVPGITAPYGGGPAGTVASSTGNLANGETPGRPRPAIAPSPQAALRRIALVAALTLQHKVSPRYPWTVRVRACGYAGWRSRHRSTMQQWHCRIETRRTARGLRRERLSISQLAILAWRGARCCNGAGDTDW